jgi:hypothetical protein
LSENRTGFLGDQAQENPDFDEQPDRAPEGMEEPLPAMRKLDAETVFLTSRLPHFPHFIVSPEVRDTSASKCALHSLQTYS